MEQLCPQRSGPPPHTHEQDEVIYVIEGQLTLIVGQEKVTAKAGSLAYIPSHCVHSFRVDTPTARLLNFYLPGGFERTIAEFAAPAESHTLPPAGVASLASSEQQQALFKRIGMTGLALPDSLRQG